MPPRVVLWDVGGTLVTHSGDLEELDLVLRRAGLSRDRVRPDAVLRALEHYHKVVLRWRTHDEERQGNRQLAALLLEGSEAATSEVTAVLTDALADYFDLYRPVPGISDLLEELKASGIRQGVVSNWPPSLRGFLIHHGLGQYFDIVVVSGEEGIVKPDPGLFRRAIDRLGVGPEHTLYVGNDPVNDQAPSRQLGMHMVHFDPQGRHRGVDARDVATLRVLLFEALGLDRRH